MAQPSMSMNKVIHAAVRRDLSRLRDALADFEDGDRERAAALHRAWTNFDEQVTHHHESEHEIAWPGLEQMGVDAATISRFDDEHDRLAQALAQARSSMDRFAGSATRADADAAASAIAAVQDVAVTHFDHEEQVTEPVFAEHAGSQAMKEMSKKFSRSLSPTAAGVYFAWLLDGAKPEEASALKATIPAPVLAVFTKLLGRRYQREIAPVWSGSAR